MKPSLRELCVRYTPFAKRGMASVLSRLQREPVTNKAAERVTSQDIIVHCRSRAETCLPSTVRQDLIALRSVLSYAKPGWGLEKVTDAAIKEAMPILKREGLVGGSQRRGREPSTQERAATAEYFTARGQTLYADIAEFQYYSTRRISETCRLMWGDLDAATKTILVRDLKHPTMKDGNNKRAALPDEALAVIMRQPRLTGLPTERIFPVRCGTVKTIFARAFRKLGFDDLHLHDFRRGGTTRLLAEGRSVPEVMLVTLHNEPKHILTTYNALKAEDFHKRRAP